MTYDYQCQECGHEWEAEQRITEDPLQECPRCKQPKAKRLISGTPGHILKGDGWFKTGGY